MIPAGVSWVLTLGQRKGSVMKVNVGSTDRIIRLVAAAAAICAVKAFKQMWQVFFRDGLSGIVDSQLYFFVFRCQGDGNFFI